VAEEEEEVEEEKEPGDQEHFKSGHCMCPSCMEKTSPKIMLYALLWCLRGCACVSLWHKVTRLMCA